MVSHLLSRLPSAVDCWSNSIALNHLHSPRTRLHETSAAAGKCKLGCMMAGGLLAALSLLSLQSEADGKPIFEVSTEIVAKNRVGLDERELNTMLLSALENGGIQKKLTFTFRNPTELSSSQSQRDRSGDFAAQTGGERGRIVRPTHLVKVTATVERTLNSDSQRIMLPLNELLDDALGKQLGRRLTVDAKRVREEVKVLIRVNIYDVVTGLSTASVPRMEAKAEGTLLTYKDRVIDHKETLRLLIFEIPIRVKDAEFKEKASSSSSGLTLANRAIDFTSWQVADEIEKLKLKPDPRLQGSDLSLESLSSDRTSVMIAGKVETLKVGELVSFMIMPNRRERVVGEPSTVSARVIQVSEARAEARIFDRSKRADSALSKEVYVDPRYPVIRLGTTAFGPEEIVISGLSINRDSVVLSGNLSGISTNDILIAGVRHKRNPEEKRAIYLKVVKVGKEAATALVWDIVSEKNLSIADDYEVDFGVLIKRL